jgi:hypothetical protein
MYPDKDWRWDFLTVNKDISLEFILKTKNKRRSKNEKGVLLFKWKLELVLDNPNITLEFIKRNIKKFKWCIHGLSRIVTEEFHDEHPELNYVWGIGGMSNNPNISFEFVKKYPDKDWDYTMHGLSRNPNMNAEFFRRLGIYVSDPSLNPKITIETIDLFKCRISYQLLSRYVDPDIVDHYLSDGTASTSKNWCFNARGLSLNVKLTHKLVDKYPNKDWDWSSINVDFSKMKNIPKNSRIWRELSSNPNVTPEFVSENINRPWNFDAGGLSNNTNIDIDFIKRCKSRHWNYSVCGLSDNPTVTPQFVLETLNKEWYFPSLSSNKGIPVKFILDNERFAWNYRYVNSNESIDIDNLDLFEKSFELLSMNPSVTFEIIQKYINKPWNWAELSRH